MNYDFLYKVNDGLATIPFNRPDKLNALTFEIYAQMRDLMVELRRDEQARRVVSPTEVENCLLEHEAVRECAVIGFQDEEGLTKTKAFVVLNENFAAGDELARALQEFVKARLARHKYPRRVVFVASLPKNDRGKIKRKSLR